ncbi:MAG: hypothetical protein H7Y30_02235 [Pyrinomonadaceae bacterium]|nr:hypothetical protein [Pyrinomonadaceae bacterium]
MKTKYIFMALITAFMTLAISAFTSCAAQEKQQTERHKTDGHSKHSDEMNKRGEREMGFSQAKTTHHFRLLQDGGAIEVEAKDEKDTETVKQIKGHLSHIAQMFGEGNFKAPMLIHDQTPPGVPVMHNLKAEISYQYEDTINGGRVRIKTANAEALRAIHEFLRFQIKEHETGDSLDVVK